eukprot:761508-Hanusia_phi.AAC.4
MGDSQDVEGKYRSIYPVIDEPLGTTIPFFPQVASRDPRPKVPLLGQGQDPSKRLDLSMSEADAKVPSHGLLCDWVDVPADVVVWTSLLVICQSNNTMAWGRLPVLARLVLHAWPHSVCKVSRLCPFESSLTLHRYYWPDQWSGNDPSCVQFTQGQQDYTSNPNGSALAVQTLPAASATIPNITLYKLNCAYVTQTQISADTVTYKNRTFVVRALFPATLGDDFGLYVRDIGSAISTSSGSPPARAWFQYSDPTVSNPYRPGSPDYGNRPPCLPAMCNGVYESPSFAKQGSKYVADVSLSWCVDVELLVPLTRLSQVPVPDGHRHVRTDQERARALLLHRHLPHRQHPGPQQPVQVSPRLPSCCEESHA